MMPDGMVERVSGEPMRLGICGWSQSGKSTVFDVLSGGQVHDHPSGRALTGVAHVEDDRLDFIASLFSPKRVTRAAVEYLDLPGLVAGPRSQEANPGILADARQTDGLIAVIRDFAATTVALPFGDIDPARDFERLWDELIFADLEMTERRIDRLHKDMKRPSANRDDQAAELACLLKVRECLEETRAISEADLGAAESMMIRGFRFLSEKPLMVVLNVGEEAAAKVGVRAGDDFGRPTVAMCARLELELDELPEDERGAFMEEMGLCCLAAGEVVSEAFRMLGLVTFFTCNEKECRAWTVPEGTKAPAAASAIHTDMERGFIRAQVVSFEDLKELGSIKEARAHGRLRLEGKDYVVREGDLIEFRFNV